MQKIKKQKNNKGFTLVETIVAVFILTLALTSLLGLTSQSLFTARYARNEITANYLLQEVVDYIRNQRDSIAFQKKDNGGGWQVFLDKFGEQSTSTLCFSSQGCYFNVSNTSDPIITACSLSGCPYLKYDENASNGHFYYNDDFSGLDSSFKRIIKLSNPTTDELLISVTMEWTNGKSNRSRTLSTSLLNWTQ